MSSLAILIVSMVASVGASLLCSSLWVKDGDLLGQCICSALGLVVTFLVYKVLARYFLKLLFLCPMRGFDSIEVVESTQKKGGGAQSMRVLPELPIGPIVYRFTTNLELDHGTDALVLTMTITGSLKLKRGAVLDCSISREINLPTPSDASAAQVLVNRLGAVILTEAMINGWMHNTVIPGRKVVIVGVHPELPPRRPIDDLVRSVRHALNMRGWNVTALKIKIHRSGSTRGAGGYTLESDAV